MWTLGDLVQALKSVPNKAHQSVSLRTNQENEERRTFSSQKDNLLSCPVSSPRGLPERWFLSQTPEQEETCSVTQECFVPRKPAAQEGSVPSG